MLCAVFSLCYVQFLIRFMCSFQSVLCAVFRLRYVQFAVTTLVASLRACLAWLGRAYACMHMFEPGKHESWCADLLGRIFAEARNEIPPYIYIYIDRYILYM